MASKDFVINILADASKAEKSIGSLTGKVQGEQSKWGALKGAATAAAAGAATAVAGFAKSSMSSFQSAASGIKGYQRITGGTVEQASALRGAFQQVGIGADTSQISLQMFAKNLNTANDNGKKAAAMTQLLGTGFTDAHGQILPMSELLPKVADTFSKMPDGPSKSAEAMKLFGKQGASMIPMLNQGSAGVEQLMQKSSDLGLTLSGQGVDAATKNARAQRDMNLAWQGAQIQLGQFLMPILTQVSIWAAGATGWMTQHRTLVYALAGVIGTLSGIYAAFNIATGVANGLSAIRTLMMGSETTATTAATGAQTGLNTAMSLNPVMLVVMAVAALVAALVLFFTKTSLGRKLWADFTGFLGSSIANVRQWFGSAGDWIVEKWHGLLDFFHSVPNAIGAAFSVVSDLITAPFRSAFGAIKSFWNSTLGGKGFDIPDWVPGVGGKSFRIPMLAKGGTITSPGLVMVGERGPEVLSLPTGARVTPLQSGGTGGSRSYSPTYNLYANDPQLVVAEIEARDRRNAVAVPIDF
ncbi:MAG: hypothetical protein LKF93_04090 [Bifidobacterium tibiigranuli]|jgi:hypothetical protein|nr:hypothetical protein [Bifidobacterium tibiigranuli]